MAIQFIPVRVKNRVQPDRSKALLMVSWGKIFDSLWMAPYVKGKGSAGNMGFRMPGGICVTPSGGALGELSPEHIMTVIDVRDEKPGIKVYFYGHPGKRPTSEALIYWDIFKKRKDVDVVLHGHDSLCLETSNAVMALHRNEVCMTPRITEAGSQEFRRDINCILSARKNYLIGKGHGFFALGKTFGEAGILALKYRTEATGLLLGKKFMERLKKKYDLC
ncbi:MAG: class II aldolase/adducin family protein [Candidatus Omnitrophica bacterium]|nr:class II aldolase/adducin family protein [Candidatus Omnitrophota bacterium]